MVHDITLKKPNQTPTKKPPTKQIQKPKQKLKVFNLGLLCEVFTGSFILSMKDKETQAQSS